MVFIRPFISSLAFPYINYIYSILFGLFVIVWFILKGVSIKKIGILKHPIILFCIAIVISVIFSLHKLNSIKETYNYAIGLSLLLISASLDYDDRIRIIHSIVFACFIISLLAIWQYFFGFQHTLDYIAKENIGEPFAVDYLMRKRVYFPFVTPNALAGYFGLVIPLVLIIKNNKKWLIILFTSLALFLTKSLGATLSILLGIGLYMYLGKRLSCKKLALLAALAIISVFIFVLRYTQTKEYLLPSFSLAQRLDYWKYTLEIIKGHIFTGVGLGNFNIHLSRYAHNSYLQLWAEAGALGLVSFAWLIGAAAKSALQNFKISADRKKYALLILANLVFLIHNIADFTFFLPEISHIWWIVLGLSI